MDKSAIVLLVLWTLIIIGGIFGIMYQGDIDCENYNEGICTQCGGNYIFSSAVYHQTSGHEYYYTCDSCGHTIITHNLMN